MQSYIFLDLDDTLFQTLRKCGTGESIESLAARAFLADGSANSFATAQQQWLWRWLSKDIKCIPVTGRDFDAFNRVDLAFDEEIVLNHGAVILDKHRRIDTNWMDTLMQSLPFYYEKLLELWRELEGFIVKKTDFKPRLVIDFDITWYGVIKHACGSEPQLTKLLETIIKPHPYVRDGSLYWHMNGNNLAVLPRTINKENAVNYLLGKYRDQHADIFTIGAGDSYSDKEFIALCDFALIPTNSQLFRYMQSREAIC